MNPATLIILGAVAFLGWKYKDELLGPNIVNPGSSVVPESSGGVDYGSNVQVATGLPASDGINPGVLPDGSIRTLPPATPAQAITAAQASGVSYTPQVVDGNWINAPVQAASSIYAANTIASDNRGKPQVLPAPTPAMLNELKQGRTMDEILGAAAAGDIYNYGGFSVVGGYYLPVYAWNYYRDQYRPGSPSAQGQQTIDVEAYWNLRSQQGLNGLGCDCNHPYTGMPMVMS